MFTLCFQIFDKKGMYTVYFLRKVPAVDRDVLIRARFQPKCSTLYTVTRLTYIKIYYSVVYTVDQSLPVFVLIVRQKMQHDIKPTRFEPWYRLYSIFYTVIILLVYPYLKRFLQLLCYWILNDYNSKKQSLKT